MIHIYKHRHNTHFSFFYQSVLLSLLNSDNTVKFQVLSFPNFFTGKEKTLEYKHPYQIFFTCKTAIIVNIKPKIELLTS